MSSVVPSTAELAAATRAVIASGRDAARRTGEPSFVDEGELEAALLAEWHGALRPLAAGLASRADLDADADGAVSEAELEAFVEAYRSAALAIFAGATAPLVVAAVGAVYERSLLRARRAPAVRRWLERRSSSPVVRLGVGFGPDDRALAWLRRHSVYWISAPGGPAEAPEIADAARRVLAEGLGADEAASALGEALGAGYKRGASYWRLVASAAVNRSRAFGRIAAFEEAGVEECQLATVADDRRSEVCAYLDGRRISVADLAAWRDRLLALGSPEAIRTAAPWRKLPEVQRLVEGNGGRVPPELGGPQYHGHCRTVLVALPPGGPPSGSGGP